MDLCSKCRKPKDGAHSSYCRACFNAYQRAYKKRRYSDEPEYRKQVRKHILKSKYGFSPEEYDEMLEKQNGGCALCGGPANGKGFHIDHDHETGEVRGILCHSCNTGIGALKESPVLLRAAIEYLT